GDTGCLDRENQNTCFDQTRCYLQPGTGDACPRGQDGGAGRRPSPRSKRGIPLSFWPAPPPRPGPPTGKYYASYKIFRLCPPMKTPPPPAARRGRVKIYLSRPLAFFPPPG